MTMQDAMLQARTHGWTPTGFFDTSGRSLWSCTEVAELSTLEDIVRRTHTDQSAAEQPACVRAPARTRACGSLPGLSRTGVAHECSSRVSPRIGW